LFLLGSQTPQPVESLVPEATHLSLIQQWVVPLTVQEVVLVTGSHSAQPPGLLAPLL
jgi:hypothetical protein